MWPFVSLAHPPERVARTELVTRCYFRSYKCHPSAELNMSYFTVNHLAETRGEMRGRLDVN